MNIISRQMVRNLRKIINESNDIYITNFRKYEYEHKLQFMLENLVRHVFSLIGVNNINIETKVSKSPSSRLYGYTPKIIYKIHCKIDEYKKEETIEFNVPDLRESYLFYIQNVVICPVLFLAGHMVESRPRSVNIRTLSGTVKIEYINSSGKIMTDPFVYITIGTNGYNIRMYLNNFMDMIGVKKDIKLSTQMLFDSHKTIKTANDILFEKKISVIDPNNSDSSINNKLTKLLFDEYSIKLYEKEFGKKFVDFKTLFEDVLAKIIEYNLDVFRYTLRNISLYNRKISFLEYFMSELYQKTLYDFISEIRASDNVPNKRNKIEMCIGSAFKVLKDKKIFFFSSINENLRYLYDKPTPFTSIIGNIAASSFTKKISIDDRRIDESQYTIICPISTSSGEPGINLHLNPLVTVDEFGYFKDRFKTFDEKFKGVINE